MDRRDFLKRAARSSPAACWRSSGFLSTPRARVESSGRRPNIVFILVDEMRFPTRVPDRRAHARGVPAPVHAQCLRAMAPRRQVRALLQRRQRLQPGTRDARDRPVPPSGVVAGDADQAGPALQPAFPTYGKLLQGVRIPDALHRQVASVQPAAGRQRRRYLANYGFIGLTNPDPTGTNGQGADNDANIAAQAVQWLQRKQQGRVALSASPSASSTRTTSSSSGPAPRPTATTRVRRQVATSRTSRSTAGAQRGEPDRARLPGAAAELGVLRRPGQARQARHPAGVPLLPGARLGRRSDDRTQTDFGPRPVADPPAPAGRRDRARRTTGSGVWTCTRWCRRWSTSRSAG